MKLLLVDDSGTMRTIQKRCFLKLGVAEGNITEAENGRVALDKFERTAFDLIVTDWNMPIMDGLTLLKEIRKRNTSVPVLMITTESERSRVVAAIQEGVSDYLVKPFTSDDLQSKLIKWVPALL
jgi:two-component system, chemotaxis family, chemotaxis protein CheY